jgi:hypothetical protein
MMPEDRNSVMQNLLAPVVLIALLILVSIFVLIGAAILGIDRGVLSNMGKAEFARGLITYLFSVVTIGTAVVLVISALTSAATEEHEKSFQRAKEILSLLLGVFGTIVGFYFGAEIRSTTTAELATLRVTPLLLSQDSVVGGETVTVTAAVSGGTPPYQYGLVLGDEGDVKYDKLVEKNNWIVAKLATPTVQETKVASVKVSVKDATGNTFQTSAPLVLEPKRGGA